MHIFLGLALMQQQLQVLQPLLLHKVCTKCAFVQLHLVVAHFIINVIIINSLQQNCLHCIIPGKFVWSLLKQAASHYHPFSQPSRLFLLLAKIFMVAGAVRALESSGFRQIFVVFLIIFSFAKSTIIIALHFFLLLLYKWEWSLVAVKGCFCWWLSDETPAAAAAADDDVGTQKHKIKAMPTSAKPATMKAILKPHWT